LEEFAHFAGADPTGHALRQLMGFYPDQQPLQGAVLFCDALFLVNAFIQGEGLPILKDYIVVDKPPSTTSV
jgi:hypothetical protein